MSVESDIKAAHAAMQANTDAAAAVSETERAIAQRASEPAKPITLDDLPLAELVEFLNEHMQPNADTFLMPHTVGPDSLR